MRTSHYSYQLPFTIQIYNDHACISVTNLVCTRTLIWNLKLNRGLMHIIGFGVIWTLYIYAFKDGTTFHGSMSTLFDIINLKSLVIQSCSHYPHSYLLSRVKHDYLPWNRFTYAWLDRWFIKLLSIKFENLFKFKSLVL